MKPDDMRMGEIVKEAQLRMNEISEATDHIQKEVEMRLNKATKAFVKSLFDGSNIFGSDCQEQILVFQRKRKKK